MARFENRVFVVTGGGTGIGRATAIQLAVEGARVVIGNRNAELGGDTVAEIERSGGIALFQRTDVTDDAQVRALVDLAVERFGGLDGAFNNAGVEGPMGPLHTMDDATYDRVLDTNLRGTFFSMRAQIPRLLERGGGAIVNNSSVAGLVGFGGQALYAAAKHAVNGLTRTAAVEVAAQGVRINSVCPGAVRTEMFERFRSGGGLSEEELGALHPIGRIGRSEEIAALVCWLLSDEASFVVGQALAADGGLSSV